MHDDSDNGRISGRNMSRLRAETMNRDGELKEGQCIVYWAGRRDVVYYRRGASTWKYCIGAV
jgi:hypothetical protein